MGMVLAFLGMPALAAQVPSANAPTLGSARATVSVEGFRSAHFGMTEPEIDAAIGADFNLTPDKITRSEVLTEHTRLLTITVPDLVPHGGKADVAYVLGYRTHKLIQVGVTWSIARDPTINADTLVTTANSLQSLFLGQGYKQGTVTTNGTLSTGGLLVFRGADELGRTTLLILQGETKIGANGGQTLTPNSLALFYILDPDHPDALKLQPGQF